MEAFLIIMEVLEILIDSLSFVDELEAENFIESGIMAGKGLANAGFTIYYIIMQFWKIKEI